MITIQLWLLISIGNSRAPTTAIERFEKKGDCEQAASLIRAHQNSYGPDLKCIQASVVKP